MKKYYLWYLKYGLLLPMVVAFATGVVGFKIFGCDMSGADLTIHGCGTPGKVFTSVAFYVGITFGVMLSGLIPATITYLIYASVADSISSAANMDAKVTDSKAKDSQ